MIANNTWRRSSKCSMGQCVEFMLTDTRVFVRDSKQNDVGHEQPRIDVDLNVWRVFLNEVRGFEPAGSNGILTTSASTEGGVQLVDVRTGVSLSFDSQEWTAFVEGVLLGEMNPPLAA